MKFLFFIFVTVLSTSVFSEISALSDADMSNLKVVEKNKQYETFKIQNPNFFKKKDFTYFTHNKKDNSNVCYSLKIDNDLNYILKSPDKETKGKLSFEKSKITLNSASPLVLQLNAGFEVGRFGMDSLEYKNGDRHIGIKIDSSDKNFFQYLFMNCETIKLCKEACLK